MSMKTYAKSFFLVFGRRVDLDKWQSWTITRMCNDLCSVTEGEKRGEYCKWGMGKDITTHYYTLKRSTLIMLYQQPEEMKVPGVS